jgi:hypothetical protein
MWATQGWVLFLSKCKLKTKQNSVVLVRERTVLANVSVLMPTFANRECRMISAIDPNSHILDFLDQSRYYFFQIAPQLYSGCWVDPVPDPLLLRKSGSARNRTRHLWSCSQEVWPLDIRWNMSKIGPCFLVNIALKILVQTLHILPQIYRVGQTQLGSFWSLITNQSNNTQENGKVPFVVDRWQLPSMIKNCLIESGPPCSLPRTHNWLPTKPL